VRGRGGAAAGCGGAGGRRGGGRGAASRRGVARWRGAARRGAGGRVAAAHPPPRRVSAGGLVDLFVERHREAVHRIVRRVAAVDVRGAEVDGVAAHLDRLDPPAHALPRLEHHRLEPALAEPLGGAEAGGARADHDDARARARRRDRLVLVRHAAVDARRRLGARVQPLRRARLVDAPLLGRAQAEPRRVVDVGLAAADPAGEVGVGLYGACRAALRAWRHICAALRVFVARR